MKTNFLSDESHQMVRKSKRIPYAKQAKKLGGIPYYTNNNKKRTNNNCILQEKQTNQLDQPRNKEETNREILTTNREIRTIAENQNIYRILRSYQQKQPSTTESTRRRGNVECRGQNTISHRLNYFRQSCVTIFTNKL